MNDTSEGTRKHFVRTLNGQPIVFAGDNGPDAVTVRIGPDGTHAIMSRAEWERLPIWQGETPAWARVGT